MGNVADFEAYRNKLCGLWLETEDDAELDKELPKAFDIEFSESIIFVNFTRHFANDFHDKMNSYMPMTDAFEQSVSNLMAKIVKKTPTAEIANIVSLREHVDTVCALRSLVVLNQRYFDNGDEDELDDAIYQKITCVCEGQPRPRYIPPWARGIFHKI